MELNKIPIAQGLLEILWLIGIHPSRRLQMDDSVSDESPVSFYLIADSDIQGYMGPTSSWSFCRRVLALIGRKVPESNCPPDPFHIDGVAFKLNWRPFPPDEVPDVTNLPPLDYALFLFSTVKFYFGFLSLMIDETAYLQDLHEFYQDPSAKAAAKRPWYCQYLLVLAFGKAFLTHRNPSGTPPGHQYASRAMALLPDLSGVDEDPLGCIQALSLGAVYLQSIDMRRAAFQHVSISALLTKKMT